MSDSAALARPPGTGSRPTGPTVSGMPAAPSTTTTYITLLRWTGAQIGSMIPLYIVVQVMLAAGVVVGFGLLTPGIDTPTALFLATGAPTVLLLTVGLVMVPQAVAQARTNGTYVYLRALPVPRVLLLLADLTVWSAAAIPAIPVAVLVARVRYGLDFRLDLALLIPAVLLVTLMAANIGYALAVVLQPLAAQLLTQVLVFFVMLFSPVTFPAERLPQWYQRLHDYLPVRAGADLIRAGLASDAYAMDSRDLVVLALWTVAGFAVTLRALASRG